jgi:16S rRNA (uracil1498-N3)-methyltransferase
MRRYWLPASALKGDAIEIEGESLHHIRDVCRMGKGSRFEVLLEGGTAYLVEVVEEAKKLSRARVIESRAIPPRPNPQIHLVLCVPRFPALEAVVEKAVELGVAEVCLALSDFSFVRARDEALEKKRARWEKIIVGATQQSGRGDLMPLRPARRLDELAAGFARDRSRGALGLFAYEAEGGEAAKGALARLKAAAPEPREAWIFVGAEGGFSTREAQMFRDLGMSPVTLGPQVLRVETACVALISILKYDFDLMR